MNANDKAHRAILQSIAHQAMLDRGLLPDFSAAALAELGRLQVPAATAGEPVRDLSNLLWASIDNDDSRDLDQLTVAEAMPGDQIKILVAIADVDSLLKNGSAIDEHAHHNTTSVYTAAEINVATPRWGTPLWHQLRQEGRLHSQDAEKCLDIVCNFSPKHMTPEECEEGVWNCYQKFYSFPSICQRLLMPPSKYIFGELSCNLFFLWAAARKINPVVFY